MLDEIFQRSEDAFHHWKTFRVSQRAEILKSVHQIVYKEKDQIAEVISNATGKPKIEALTSEVIPVLDLLLYFIKKAPKILKEKTRPLHLLMQKKSIISYEPYGTVLIVSPWNYPLSIPMGDIILALLAGNVVILKPSEVTEPVSRLIQDLFSRSDVPKDVVQVIFGGGDVGQKLVSSERIHKISFTGSTATGQKILEAAAKNITPSTMELGGKDAAIVLKDAPLQKTIEGIVWGAFMNAGQTCASIQRVYVQRDSVQRFVEGVVAQTQTLKLETDVGAITLPQQLERYESQLEDAVRKGAKILCGGQKEERNGRPFFQPTVLVNCTDDMEIVKTETFGPMLPILMFDTEEEVIGRVNRSPYGLCASIWTKNKTKAIQMAHQIQAGTVTINDAVFTHALCETPWGGTKKSGIGRAHGEEGLKSFCQVKHINYDRIGLKPFWWYPYTRQSLDIAGELADMVGKPTAWGRFKAMLRFLVVYLFK